MLGNFLKEALINVQKYEYVFKNVALQKIF